MTSDYKSMPYTDEMECTITPPEPEAKPELINHDEYLVNYFKHLKSNWKVALSTRYHTSWFHTISDILEHFLHGLIPCIKWKHKQREK